MAWLNDLLEKLLGVTPKGPAKVLDTLRGEPITWKKPEETATLPIEATFNKLQVTKITTPPTEAKTMQLSKDGLDLITHFEGLSLKPYLDSIGVPTIGYGSTFYEDGTKVTMKDAPITEARARSLMLNVLKSFEVKTVALLPKGAMLSDNQYSALLAFAYNCGTGNLASSTLLKLVKAGDYNGAAEQFARWDKAGGQPLKGLTIRRYCERALFLGKDWRAAEVEIRKKLG